MGERQARGGVFGVSGARELTSRSERPLEVAVAAIAEAIAAHAPVLTHLADKFEVRSSRIMNL